MAANGPPNKCTPADLDAATGRARPSLGAGALEAAPVTCPGHCSTALAASDCSNQLLLLVWCLDVTVSGSPKLECTCEHREAHPTIPSFVRRWSSYNRRSRPRLRSPGVSSGPKWISPYGPRCAFAVSAPLLLGCRAMPRHRLRQCYVHPVDARERGACHPRLPSRLRPCDASQGALCTCSWCDFYTIPASLSLGQCVTSDSAAGKRLSTLITRKGSASRAAG